MEILHEYKLLNNPETLLKKGKETFIVPETILSYFENLNKLSDLEVNIQYNIESRNSSILEGNDSFFDTITDSNSRRSSSDPLVIEPRCIGDTYRKLDSEEIKPISIDILKDIHIGLFKELEQTKRFSGSKAGEFTKLQNLAGRGYMTCPLEYKEEQLVKWIEFFNEKPTDLTEAIIRTSIIHYWFAGIHIFEDGNSRTGRLLISYYFKLHNYTKHLTFTISESICNVGYKQAFVMKQAEAWDDNDPLIYSDWFINTVIKDMVKEQE